MSVAEGLQTVRQTIADVCQELGRSHDSVHLIAVSKRHPPEAIEAALQAGQHHFGENFAQELRDKARALPSTLNWHFMGRIQRNKAKYIAPVAHRVHSLETVEQAEALGSRSEHPLGCLIAVNIGREQQKSGVSPSELLHRLRALDRVPQISVHGLMCLPPHHEDPEETAPYFEEMASLLAAAKADGFPLDELSMGMSHDYHVALRYGATWLRVGTAIFGQRKTT
jgi:PLP dependent protein